MNRCAPVATSPSYFPSLDGLRAVAVGIVLIAHAGAPFPRSGGVGVDIFFTLSGFLITTLLLREFAEHASISLRNFYARRFLRLIPCLWLTVAAYVVVSLLVRGEGEPLLWTEAAFALTYAMNWTLATQTGGDGFLGHTWSLAIEEQYYLLWPVVIVVMCRTIHSHARQGVALLSLAIGVMMYRAALASSATPQRIYFGLDTHADGLLIGSALACFYVAKNQATAVCSAESPIRSHLLGYAGTPIAIAALLAVMALWTWQDRAMAIAGYDIAAVASAVVILDLIGNGPSLIRSLLSKPVLVWFGRISYGLYLWHYPIYGVLSHFDFMWDWKRKLLVGLPLTIAIAAASYYFVEKRFLRLKHRFERRQENAVIGTITPELTRAAA